MSSNDVYKQLPRSRKSDVSDLNYKCTSCLVYTLLRVWSGILAVQCMEEAWRKETETKQWKINIPVRKHDREIVSLCFSHFLSKAASPFARRNIPCVCEEDSRDEAKRSEIGKKKNVTLALRNRRVRLFPYKLIRSLVRRYIYKETFLPNRCIGVHDIIAGSSCSWHMNFDWKSLSWCTQSGKVFFKRKILRSRKSENFLPHMNFINTSLDDAEGKNWRLFKFNADCF